MPEIRKRVPGYPAYEVSSTGRVYSYLERYWGQRWSKTRIGNKAVEVKRQLNSYSVKVTLYNEQGGKTFGVAHLVLLTFVRPPKPGEVARHYHDPDPWNLQLSNLRWGTEKENADDSVRHYGKHPSALHTRSEESKQKTSETMRSRGIMPVRAAIEKAAAMKRGVPRSEETKRKISETKRLRKMLKLQGAS